MKKFELLAPAGNMERLKTAIYYGADALYFAGHQFGLRAFGPNFDEEELKEAVSYCHEKGVKAYITVNIFAHNSDIDGLLPYLKFLDSIKVDGVIVSDLGVAGLVKEHTSLELHVSTQANVVNKECAKQWVKFGAKRLVLARELSLEEIKEIRKEIPSEVEIECFCHGAMCISYSGRCLLSNYFTHRDSNRGECAQPCRWEYALVNKDPENDVPGYFPIGEDERGTYILNSKDMCLIEHIKELMDAGITSFKIEGRMKSIYYVATVVNAYRRAIDNVIGNKTPSFDYIEELCKTSNRTFTTGFYFNEECKTNTLTSKTVYTHNFVANVVKDSKDGYTLVEMRNRFKRNEYLEVLSPNDTFDKQILIQEIKDLDGNEMEEVRNVQQLVYIKVDAELHQFDILRRKII